jgi:uncharacterized protein
MTPQETELVNALFDRLAPLETAPRDAAAERLIADGLQRAPHAVYALVQTALVQDEVLKRANARIEELQTQADEPAPEQRPASFLDTMREALTGRASTRGSVPSVHPAPSNAPQDFEPQPAYPQQTAPGYPGSLPGAGGSFLGTAASAAAGMIGGALLLDGIRSMFDHHAGGYGASPFGVFPAEGASPWHDRAADSDLARDLGADHIGDHDAAMANDPSADADTDDVNDADYQEDGDEPDYQDDGDLDAGDPGSDTYDV